MMLRAVVSKGKTMRRIIFRNPMYHWVGAPSVGLFAPLWRVQPPARVGGLHRTTCYQPGLRICQLGVTPHSQGNPSVHAERHLKMASQYLNFQTTLKFKRMKTKLTHTRNNLPETKA
jgi:hypothetical protein